MDKICNRCKINKLFHEFRVHKHGKQGLYSICRECESLQGKKYYNEPDIKAKKIKYRNDNKEHLNAARRIKDRANYRINIEQKREKARIKQSEPFYKEYQKRWQKENREKTRLYYKTKQETDPAYRACKNVRARLSHFLKGKIQYSRSFNCSRAELRSHLESLFQPGMSWENYGKWHIDHKYPLSVAHAEGPESFKKACHYTNLQPLWALDNIKKSDKVI